VGYFKIFRKVVKKGLKQIEFIYANSLRVEQSGQLGIELILHLAFHFPGYLVFVIVDRGQQVSVNLQFRVFIYMMLH